MPIAAITPVVSFVADSGDATDWYPSLVAERAGELRFGLDAQQVGTDPSWTLVRSFKRLLSSPSVMPNTPVVVGSVTMGIGELIARFLDQLRQDILRRSNVANRVRGKTLRAAVATPANAHSAQRFITLDAFRQAGFEVLAMLAEPSAAGLEYAHRYRNTITSRREHVVVYDLGGGTFDVSLVRMAGQCHDVVTTTGVGRLGGDDFDAALMKLVLAQAGLEPDALAPAQQTRLLEQCRQVKEALNPNSRRLVVELDASLHDGQSRVMTVPVADYYEACAPLIAKTIDVMVPVMARLANDEPLDSDQGLSDVAGIYVVGGASSLPAIGRELRQRFGRRVHRSPYPSAATAMGLAIAADEGAGFSLTERFSRTFGVFREGHDGTQVVFDPIFTTDTPLPAASSQPTIFRRTYRAAHNIGHFRFLECGWIDSDGSPGGDITPFADVRFPFDPRLRSAGADLNNTPVQRSGPDAGPMVEEMYAVDANGIVQVTIRDLSTRYELVHRLAG